MTATIIKNLDEISGPLKNPALTIGNFDGVHQGHLALFNKVKKLAQKNNGVSVVMTFDPHPLKVMKPQGGPPLITIMNKKLELIAQSEIDIIICLSFTKKFSMMSAHDFILDVLIQKIGIKELIVGHDYTFGHNREGNIKLLQNIAPELKFGIHIVDPIHINKTLVSSTSVRKIVQNGDITHANKLLGREYQVHGTVIKGAGRGGEILGFPTANLEIEEELIPAKGVYAVTVEIDRNKYSGVCNIGHNPTFGKNALSIETHALDFSGDLFGKKISINFVKLLRKEKAFKNISNLSKQITKDIELAKDILANHE